MLRKESWVAGFLFLCGGFGVRRCGGSVVAVRVWQGACRPLTDATLWLAKFPKKEHTKKITLAHKRSLLH